MLMPEHEFLARLFLITVLTLDLIAEDPQPFL
jgi:hypothetical protein